MSAEPNPERLPDNARRDPITLFREAMDEVMVEPRPVRDDA